MGPLPTCTEGGGLELYPRRRGGACCLPTAPSPGDGFARRNRVLLPLLPAIFPRQELALGAPEQSFNSFALFFFFFFENFEL